MTDIYLYAETPPSLDSESFGEDGIEGITLHVPATAIEAYKADNRWSRNCESIVALADADPVGIRAIDNSQLTIDNSERAYYRLDGHRTPTLQKGLNIVRQKDGTVRKVTTK